MVKDTTTPLRHPTDSSPTESLPAKRMMRRRGRLFLDSTWLTASLLLLAGCHTFTSSGIGEVSPGDVVRARVSGSFSDSLMQVLDGSDVGREVEGTVVEGTADAIVIDVAVTKGFQGMRRLDLNQRIRLPASELVSMESRRLDRGRSAIAVGGTVAGLAFVVAREFFGDAGGSQRPGTTGPLERRIRFVTISLAVGWPP